MFQNLLYDVRAFDASNDFHLATSLGAFEIEPLCVIELEILFLGLALMIAVLLSAIWGHFPEFSWVGRRLCPRIPRVSPRPSAEETGVTTLIKRALGKSLYFFGLQFGGGGGSRTSRLTH